MQCLYDGCYLWQSQLFSVGIWPKSLNMSYVHVYCYITQQESLFKNFCIKYRHLKKLTKYSELMTLKVLLRTWSTVSIVFLPSIEWKTWKWALHWAWHHLNETFADLKDVKIPLSQMPNFIHFKTILYNLVQSFPFCLEIQSHLGYLLWLLALL